MWPPALRPKAFGRRAAGDHKDRPYSLSPPRHFFRASQAEKDRPNCGQANPKTGQGLPDCARRTTVSLAIKRLIEALMWRLNCQRMPRGAEIKQWHACRSHCGLGPDVRDFQLALGHFSDGPADVNRRRHSASRTGLACELRPRPPRGQGRSHGGVAVR